VLHSWPPTHGDETTVSASRKPQPGKILHERCGSARWRACARCSLGRYYGSVDADAACSDAAGRNTSPRPADSRKTVRELWPARAATLQWIDNYGGPAATVSNYDRAATEPMACQSGLEGFWRRDLSRGREACRSPDRAVRGCRDIMRRKAARRGLACAWATRQRERIDVRSDQIAAAFRGGVLVRRSIDLCYRARWGETYAGVASNAGHACDRRIVAPDRARVVAATLLGYGRFPAGGIRTVALSARRL